MTNEISRTIRVLLFLVKHSVCLFLQEQLDAGGSGAVMEYIRGENYKYFYGRQVTHIYQCSRLFVVQKCSEKYIVVISRDISI